jgi:hypothetical protein
MKIDSSVLDLRASHVSESSTSVRERLRMWVGDRPDFEGSGSRQVAADAAPAVSISAAARAAAEADAAQAGTAQAGAAESTGEATDAVDADPVLSVLRQLIEYLTGRPVRIFSGAETSAAPAAGLPSAAQQSAAPGAPSRAGFGVEYDRTEVRQEHEATSFAATGVVRTQDGREIRFQVELAMARDYREESSVSLRLGDAVRKTDPLVLNFAGTAAQLADARVSFDLDSNGTAEALPMLAGGSAYLVFDRNGNGRADDGRELFGPATGNGFAELSALDGDGNGWIDEADAAWSSLRLWAPSSGGALESLAAAGVGAISTGSVATAFALRGTGNSELGEVRASGVWLGEQGGAGSVQQVDLFA